jgi:hypothetical protein
MALITNVVEMRCPGNRDCVSVNSDSSNSSFEEVDNR